MDVDVIVLIANLRFVSHLLIAYMFNKLFLFFASTQAGPTRPFAQVVQTAGRPHSMPSWRGYLPMKFEPLTVDQYQTTSHFSQKVFLGGIPAELTEGKMKF